MVDLNWPGTALAPPALITGGVICSKGFFRTARVR